MCEMQFADFIACGFDQLVNVAAKMNYRQGLAVPMVVRLPSGGGFSGGPFHSQNPEAWFLQAPGLKVVAPSTARGRQGAARRARCATPTPCSTWSTSTSTAGSRARCPRAGTRRRMGELGVAREGTDLTVVAYGAMVHTALEATEDVDASVEVLDLRTLCPLDREGILAQRAQDEQGRGAARGHALLRRGRRGVRR